MELVPDIITSDMLATAADKARDAVNSYANLAYAYARGLDEGTEDARIAHRNAAALAKAAERFISST